MGSCFIFCNVVVTAFEEMVFTFQELSVGEEELEQFQEIV
jgi:hypothetical protein